MDLLEKTKNIQKDYDEDMNDIICYFLEQIIYNEMLVRQMIFPGDYRIDDYNFYEKEKDEFKVKRKMAFNNKDNVKLLNMCSYMRTYTNGLPENTSRNHFIRIIGELYNF